jgi:Flp pilus assembly protein TadG
MIVALAMPVLIGGSGLAVDISQWYMWKRELQHSVDQAAYAGAWAMTRTDSAGTYQTRAQQEFAANLKVTRDFATQPAIRIADYAGGDDNSVVVSASATKTLPFSSFLTGSGVTIAVSAQASFAEGADYNACLVSTANTGTGTSIGGNATVDAKCGLAALSCDEDAITVDGSATVITNVLVACGKIEAPDDLNGSMPGGDSEDVVVEDVRGLTDPFAGIEPVLNSTPRNYDCSGGGNRKIAALQPGTYYGLVLKCTTTMQSGIYVIDGGELDLSGNFNVSGMGVQFVLRNGARLKLGGSGNDNRINLTPPTADQLSAITTAEKANLLQGMLIIEDRNNNPANPGHQLNGNSASLIEGNIYLPSGTLQINGTARVTSQCLQVTANRIEILGNAVLKTFCPTDKTKSVGSAAADVRLVS